MSDLDRATGAARGPAPAQPHVILNFMTILGAIIAAAGLGGAGFALVAGFLNADPSAVKGILGYVVMPNVALFGVLLMAAGVARGAWRAARAAEAAGQPPSVRIDIGGWRQLLGIAAFAGIAIGALIVLGGTAYRGIEFTESTTFCGTCHRAMQPQVEAHLTGPHVDVECAKCHVAYRASPLGPNTTAYLSSKIGGMRQLLAVMTDSFDRPIRAPANAIPATNSTCQACHPADKDYRVVLRAYQEYADDEGNTRHTRVLAFNVGAAGDQTANANGPVIHWHASAKLYYIPTDESRSAISWAGVEGPGGLDEWTNPNAPLAGTPVASQRQLMSCIDCHNRAGHRIPTPDELVDDALEHGRIDRTLPYVKREAVSLLGGTPPAAAPDVLGAEFSRSGWFDQLAKFYADNYPEIAATRQDAIRSAVNELKKMSAQILYPAMGTDWLTYPDNLSHALPAGIGATAAKDTPGCFRCHGTLVNVKTKQLLPGTMGGGGCLACHGVASGSTTAIGAVDPTKTQVCSYCHHTVEEQAVGIATTISERATPISDASHP
jgi:nitrate/TMAO reductase-like tetraheme cytochrome c subunit